MARELHSLNETEMGMVNEYVEAGIASSHEEALKFLLESGMIQDRVGGGGTYIPEGYAYLKFHNGHQKSKFTQVDKLAKKAKKDSPFEVENWYLGAEFPKDDSDNIILDSVVKGEELGQNPTLVVTHIMYSGKRFNPVKPNEAVNTTLANSMSNEHQKQMIDLKSKKSLYDIRQEQLKQYGVKKYADVEKDEKVKFAINVFGLAKTENGWNKFWLIDTVGKPEFRLEEEFQDEVKKSKKASWNYIVELNTNEDPNSAGNYNRKLIIKGELDADTRKEVLPLIGEASRSISKFLEDQKAQVSRQVSAGDSNQASNDTLDDEEINWDN
jgi:hypothetical protein